MELEYDNFEYETFQDEMAIDMMSEAIREGWQMDEDYSDFEEEDDDCYWEEDRYDRWAEVENREMLGIEAYAHWNEDAPLMWWMEEGRFQ